MANKLRWITRVTVIPHFKKYIVVHTVIGTFSYEITLSMPEKLTSPTKTRDQNIIANLWPPSTKYLCWR
jgi:hypothetical protein